MAICSIFNEVLFNECEVNKFESQVRRSSVKKMNMVRKKKIKEPARVGDLKKLLAKVGGKDVKPVERIVAMYYILAYLGCRRFSDINKIRASDVCIGEDCLSFYMKTSKTDVEAKGKEFDIINLSMGPGLGDGVH